MSQPPYSGPPNPGQPWSGPPNPDVPSSVPPQPGPPPPYGAQPGYPASGESGYPPPGYPPQGAPGYPPQGAPGYPESGTPGYPTSGAPGYPPQGAPGYPTSGAPGYPPDQAYTAAPDYGQPSYAMAGPPVPPPKKSKALPIVLISLAVFLVLCVGGVAVVFVAARDTTDEIVKAAESAAAEPPATPEALDPTTPAPEPTETTPVKTITVVEPKTLGGRPKLTDPQFAGAAEQLQSGLDDVPGASKTVGALYGTPEKRDIVIIAGVAAPVDDPAEELDNSFFGAGIGGLKVTGITSVDTGSLGGVAKCGKTSTSGINMAMCGWADDGSLGWIIWYFKSVSKAKAEFPKLRAQIEKSS